MSSLRIEVPASSANLGPGFDTLAIALDIAATVTATYGGDGVFLTSSSPGIDPERNLVCDAYRLWGEAHGRSLPPVHLTIDDGIPAGRGLGSSAACIVAGLTAAAHASGRVDMAEILSLAARMEGHADNVAAAVLGGVVAAFRDADGAHAIKVAGEMPVGVALFIPANALRTSDARACLPTHVPLADAVFNLGRTSYLVAAASAGCWEEVGRAMKDRLHQPYRAHVIPAMTQLLLAAEQAGAYGAALSGAGPSIFALTSLDLARVVADAMGEAALSVGCAGRATVTRLRREGAIVETV